MYFYWNHYIDILLFLAQKKEKAKECSSTAKEAAASVSPHPLPQASDYRDCYGISQCISKVPPVVRSGIG